jgi:hypothetical protein
MLRLRIDEHCLANYCMAFLLYLRERRRRRGIAIITILKQERDREREKEFTLLLNPLID